MANTNNKKDFSKFGSSFQRKLVELILRDRAFADQIEEVLDIEFFESKYLRVFADKIFEYRREHDVHPSLDIMSTIVRSDIDEYPDPLKTKVREYLARIKSKGESAKVEDESYIKEKAIEFCKKQELRAAIYEAYELTERDRDEEVEGVIREALRKGQNNDVGHEYIKDFESRYEGRSRNPITTGWDNIDEITQGGHGLGELGVVIAPTGCHAEGTKILMFDGTIKSVEDVKVGDNLMGPDSEPRSVLSLNRGREEMYKITPVKGQSFVVDKNHVLSLKKSGHDHEIVNVTVDEYVNEWSDYYRKNYKLYRESVQFGEKDLDIDPYCLGLLLGDGSFRCNGRQARYSTADDILLEEITKFSDDYEYEVKKLERKRTIANDYTISGNGKHVLEEILEGYGYKNCHSRDKFIPHKYKASSIQQRLEILAGLMDSDGSLSRKHFDYISTSEQLTDDVLFIARSVGLACYKSEKKVDGTIYYRLSISGDTGMVPTRLPRKQAAERRQIKDPLVTGIESVEKVGIDKYYGFTVDKDNLYLMGDFTVTHNCGKSMVLTHFGTEALKEGKNVVHYTLELRDSTVGNRYDSCYTGVPLDLLDEKKEEVLGEIKDIDGELVIKEYPTKSASTQTIKRHLEKIIRRGKQVDTVIVDYADLMRPVKGREMKRDELESIYENLRAIAKEFEVAVWTASQTNRKGLNKEVITMEEISEAFNKCFVSDFIFTLARTNDDKNMGTGRILIAKNRNGPDGMVYPIFMEPGRVSIKVLDRDDTSVREMREERQEEMKKDIGDIYQSYKQQ